MNNCCALCHMQITGSFITLTNGQYLCSECSGLLNTLQGSLIEPQKENVKMSAFIDSAVIYVLFYIWWFVWFKEVFWHGLIIILVIIIIRIVYKRNKEKKYLEESYKERIAYFEQFKLRMRILMLHDVNNDPKSTEQLTIDLMEKRESIFDYWPTYPPDWSDRRKEILKKYENRCVKCGIEYRMLDIHHVKKLRLGGSNRLENLIPLCRECHSQEPEHVHLYNS